MVKLIASDSNKSLWGGTIMVDIGILMSMSALDSSGGPSVGVADRITAITAGLTQTGRINALRPSQHTRQNPWDPANTGAAAASVVNAVPPPTAIFSSCYPTMTALAQVTTTIPIVYAGLFNPTAADTHGGNPNSYYFSHPNVTGFVSHEFDVCRQWPVLLKTIAPTVTQALVIYESVPPGGQRQFREISSAAGGQHLTIWPIDLSPPSIITSTPALDAAILNVINGVNGAPCGLIVTTCALTASLTADIIGIAQNRRLPAIYPNRLYTARGGLFSYGADLLDLYRRAGGYLGRILNGGTLDNNHTSFPARLPRSDRGSFEVALNRGTASALGGVIDPQGLASVLAAASRLY